MKRARVVWTARALSLGAALLAALLFGAPASASAQSIPAIDSGQVISPNPVGQEAIGRLRSPYCPGFMLENCTSGLAGYLRDSINALADQGWSADSLVEWMVANHGEEFRAFPRFGGDGLLAWLGPPAFLLAGVTLVVVILARIRAREPARVPPAPLSEAEEDRIRVALRELEAEDD